MTPQIKQNEDDWQQKISEFHAYLRQTIESLAHKKEVIRADEPSLPDPNRVKSPPKGEVKSDGKLLNPVLHAPEDKAKATLKTSKSRLYSSPLWVGLGDEEAVQSTRKTKPKRKTKR